MLVLLLRVCMDHITVTVTCHNRRVLVFSAALHNASALNATFYVTAAGGRFSPLDFFHPHIPLTNYLNVKYTF